LSVQNCVNALRGVLGERLSDNISILDQHGRDESWHPARRPAAVCFPTTVEEISAAVRVCADHQVPVIPFGAGSSLEGQVIPTGDAVTISLSRMDQILAVRPDDMDCELQAGVTRERLNTELRATGLHFPVDPGANATLGGMAATRASGTTTVRYGGMRDNVMGLKVVMADGTIVRTGSRARKSSAGYDLTRLFVGSEGTLGIIAELTLRLHPRPEHTATAVIGFERLETLVAAVTTVMQLGLPVARCEMLDALYIKAVNAYSGLSLNETPTLFLELHGGRAEIDNQMQAVIDVSEMVGGGNPTWSSDPERVSRLWEARHKAYYAGLQLRPGARGFATDVCVPMSSLAECIEQTQADLQASDIIAPAAGHVADGNFHLCILIDPDSKTEIAAAEELHGRLIDRALSLGGTCTGEHGIGTGKAGYLRTEHGTGVDVMSMIKRGLDPLNIMNPGKMLLG